jgi:hypothetical protein
MHLKVFVKLKKTLKTLSSGQKNPKKPKKTQKTQKKPKKTKKKPLGWVFLKKPGFFPTLRRTHLTWGAGPATVPTLLIEDKNINIKEQKRKLIKLSKSFSDTEHGTTEVRRSYLEDQRCLTIYKNAFTLFPISSFIKYKILG